MLTGLFFVGGLVAFSYLCWWIFDNERTPEGALPQRGFLAMATAADVASEAKEKKMPAWKRKKNAPEPAVAKAKSGRTPSYRRTGR